MCWGVAADETVGLFVAMNYRLKGLAPLLNAYAIASNEKPGKLVVVGHPKVGRYRDQASRLGIADRVLFLGHRSDPKDCYFAADYLVHPTFYDPCSLVVLEALACGLPVITSRYNGASELLNPPVEGLVVEDPHNARVLADAVLRMHDRGYLREASAAARAAGAKWTFDHHYRALLERLFRSPPHPARGVKTPLATSRQCSKFEPRRAVAPVAVAPVAVAPVSTSASHLNRSK